MGLWGFSHAAAAKQGPERALKVRICMALINFHRTVAGWWQLAE